MINDWHLQTLVWGASKFRAKGFNLAYEKAYKDPVRTALLTNAATVTPADLDSWLLAFLNAWRCRLPRTSFGRLVHPVLATGVPRLVSMVSAGVRDGKELAEVFDRLSGIALPKSTGSRQFEAVAVAKTLGLLFPGAFCMWDDKIASSYGFAKNGAGYERFNSLMSEHASRFGTAYLKLGGRGSLDRWLAVRFGSGTTTMKVIDELNWMLLVAGEELPNPVPVSFVR